MTNVVIAYYKEDLSWIEQLDTQLFKPIIYSKGEDKKGISLPNIGRESHTYCIHILDNWNYLSDFTVFCQGNPFDHCANFLEEIKVPHGTMLTDDYYSTDYKGCPQHCGLDMEKYRKLIMPEETFPIRFGAGAQFKVPKETIHGKGFDFWFKLLHYHYDDVSFGWIVERLWKKMLLI